MAKALCLSVGVVVVVLCYLGGLPTAGGALLFSGVVVGVAAALRSGVLSTSWLQSVPSNSLRSAANLELAKALVCGGLVVDALLGARSFIYLVPSRSAVLLHTVLAIVIVVGLVLGSGAFLARWYAAWLMALR